MANRYTHHYDLIVQTVATCLHARVQHGTLKASPPSPSAIPQPLVQRHPVNSIHPHFAMTQKEPLQGSIPTAVIQLPLAFPLHQYHPPQYLITSHCHRSLPPRHVRVHGENFRRRHLHGTPLLDHSRGFTDRDRHPDYHASQQQAGTHHQSRKTE